MTSVEPRFSPFPVEMDVQVFRLCISKWANQNKVKGDPDGMHASFLYAIGHNINMESGSWIMSWYQISQAMAQHRKKLGRHTKALSKSSMRRYTNWARENGLIRTERTPFRYVSGKVLPGANRIWVNVNRVVVDGEVREYDFFSPLNDENPGPVIEDAPPPIPDSVSPLTLVRKNEPSMNPRWSLDEPSDEPSMNPNTVLDTGETRIGTVLETVQDTVRRKRRGPLGSDSKNPKTTSNASTGRVLQTWASWNKVSTGSIGKDIGTSVSPGRLKAVLDGYRQEFLDRAIWGMRRTLDDFLGGEKGLRKRLDEDIGLNLVYTSELREIERKEQTLAEHWNETSHQRRDIWKTDVENFRRRHPVEVA